MRFIKKVVVAVDLTEDMEKILSPIHNMDFIKEADIHLVHASMKLVYGYPIDFGGMTYPLTEDRVLIEKAVVEKISSLQERILPSGHSGHIVVKCIFGENPAEAFCDYAQKVHADLLIVAPRSDKGFFDTSFAKYVIKHSRSHVFMIR